MFQNYLAYRALAWPDHQAVLRRFDDRGRRSGAGQPGDRARLEPYTPNNSETLRQIALKATASDGSTQTCHSTISPVGQSPPYADGTYPFDLNLSTNDSPRSGILTSTYSQYTRS